MDNRRKPLSGRYLLDGAFDQSVRGVAERRRPAGPLPFSWNRCRTAGVNAVVRGDHRSRIVGRYSFLTRARRGAVMKMLVQRRFAVLVSLASCAFSWSALGAPSGAEPLGVAPTATATAHGALARSGRALNIGAAAASAGYECAPSASLVTAKPGVPGTITVHLGGFVVTYRGKEAHLATGLFAYPGAVTVTEATRTWPLPQPANPRDQYFQLGALCAIQFVAVPLPTSWPRVTGEGHTAAMARPCTGTRGVRTASWRT